MAESGDWYPATRAKQRAMYANVLTKIDNHKAAIADLTDARVARIKLICLMFIALYDWLEQTEAALKSGYEYQREMEKGTANQPAPPVPKLPALALPPDAFTGFVKEFRDDMGLLKKQKGYTRAIGEDLMIVGEKGESISPAQRQPDFKYEFRQGYRLNVTGSMQGMRAANFYYRRKGQTEWIFVGYLTRTPGEIHIPPAQTGMPEVGEIKAIFSENNEEVGQFSTNTEVTLS